MQNISGDFSMEDAMHLAKSDAGQQLFAMLMAQDANTMNQAMAQASAGDYTQIRKTLASLLSSPQVQEKIAQLRRNNDG